MDSLFHPDALTSIASLCGVELKEKLNTEGETLENTEASQLKAQSKSVYRIRRGTEDDILKENQKDLKPTEASSRISDYSFEDFQKEFLDEKTNDDLYDEDSRNEAEYEIQSGGTYEAGRLLDKEYMVVG